MSCFVDTSALYAVLDRDDAYHAQAETEWRRLIEGDTDLVTTNYVLVETVALVQHRLGIDAVQILHEDIGPVLRVEWVDESLHEAGMDGVLDARRRKLSFVDCVSFSVMRRLGIREAFAFDQHYDEQGFARRSEPEP